MPHSRQQAQIIENVGFHGIAQPTASFGIFDDSKGGADSGLQSKLDDIAAEIGATIIQPAVEQHFSFLQS